MFKKILAVLAMALFATVSLASTWPDKPVKIVIPFGPGGGNDVIARIIGQQLSTIWNQPVVFENRPGGNFVIGIGAVAKSDPDGYTLLSIQPNIIGAHAALVDNLPYDWNKDLVPLGWMGEPPPYVLAVSAKSGIKTIGDLRKYGKAKGISYSSAGTGSTFHIYGAILAESMDIKGVHIPYKSTPQMLLDVASGDVDMVFGPMHGLTPHIQAGNIVPVAAVGYRPHEKLPGLPTTASLHIPNFPNESAHYSLYGPAGIPENVQKKITEDIAKAYANALPDLLARNLVSAVPAPRNFQKTFQDQAQVWFKLTQKIKE